MAGSFLIGRRAPAWVLGLSLLLGAGGALAQPVDDTDRNAARSLAGQAKDSFDRGDYEKARDLFHRAYQLVQAPTISLYEARALVKLGRLVEAEEAYTRTVRTNLAGETSDQFRKAVHEAGPELAALQPRIPRLVIAVSGPGAGDPSLRVTIDGEPVKSALLGVEMPVNPGTHTIRAQVQNGAPTEQSLTIQERENKSTELTVAAATIAAKTGDAPPPLAAPRDTTPLDRDEPGMPWQRKAAFVAGGVGAVGLGVGIATGLMAASRYSTAERECPNRHCAAGSTGADAVQSFRSLRTVSTIGYIVGGIGLAAGVTLFVTAPSAKSQRASLGVFVSAEQAGVVGVF